MFERDEAVGDAAGALETHDFSRRERVVQLGSACRLDSPHHSLASCGRQARHHAGNQAAAAHRDDHRLDLGKLLDDLERDGRLAGDNVGMIERRYDREMLLARDRFRLDTPIFRRPAREHDFAAPLLDALDLTAASSRALRSPHAH